MRILAIKLRELGDTIIWTSALQALSKLFPQGEIHTLTLRANEPILQNLPFIQQQHYLEKRSGLELISKLIKMRQWKFDSLLGFHANTSLVRWSFLAGSKQKVLHHHSWLHTPRQSSLPIAEPGKLENSILRDYQILRALGFKDNLEKTHIEITDAEKKWAHEKLSDLSSEKPKLALLPGARTHLRRYPVDLWTQKVKLIQEQNKFAPVVLADQSISKDWDLKSLCKELDIPLIDNVTLRQFMALISICQYGISQDSGPNHMAVALGLKTVTLFGPGCYGDWHPYDEKTNPVLRVPVDCRGSGPRDLPDFQYCAVQECSHHSCLRNISPQNVVDRLNSLTSLG